MKERRQFYRIDDHIALNYRIVPEQHLREGIARLKLPQQQRTLMQSVLVGTEARLDQVIAQFETALPEIAEAIELLNRKTNLIGRMAHMDAYPDDVDEIAAARPTHNVNISAGGLAFRSAAAIDESAYLEMELVLFPSHHYIRAFGQVVSCQDDRRTDSGFPYRVRVNFEFVRDEDREYLVSHTLKKQSQLLRDGRRQRLYSDVEEMFPQDK